MATIIRNNDASSILQLETTLDSLDEMIKIAHDTCNLELEEALPLIEKVNDQFKSLNPEKLSSSDFYRITKKISRFKTRCEETECLIWCMYKTLSHLNCKLWKKDEQNTEIEKANKMKLRDAIKKSRLEVEKTQITFRKTIREIGNPLSLTKQSTVSFSKQEMTRSKTAETFQQLESNLVKLKEILQLGDPSAVKKEALPLLKKVDSEIQALHPARLTSDEFDYISKKIENLISAIKSFQEIENLMTDLLHLQENADQNSEDDLNKISEAIVKAYEILKATEKAIIKKTQQTFNDRVLENGICYGTVLSLMEQPQPIFTEKTEARARYIQTCYHVNKKYSEFNAKQAGLEILLGNSPAREHILKEVAKRFGFEIYDDWVKSKIGTNIFQLQIENPHILNIVGNICFALEKEYSELIIIKYKESLKKNDEALDQSSLDPIVIQTLLKNKEGKDKRFKEIRQIVARHKIQGQFVDIAKFLKKTPLNDFKAILQKEHDLIKFKKQLDMALEKPGEYAITITNKNFGHAVYISFEPDGLMYKFCDANMRTLNGLPIGVSFEKKKYLLDYVHKYLSQHNPHDIDTNWALFKVGKKTKTNPTSLTAQAATKTVLAPHKRSPSKS